MASYPSSIKAFSTKTIGQTVAASHVNDLQDEVTAIETALLTGPLTVNGFVPSVTATYDLGTTLLRYRDFFFSRNGLIGGTLGVTGAVTGGLYNGQTISAAASLTGTLAVAGASTLAAVTAAGITANTLNAAANVHLGKGIKAIFGSTSGGFILSTDSTTEDWAYGVKAGGGWSIYAGRNTTVDGTEVFNLTSAGALKLTTAAGTVTEQNRAFAMGATQAVAFDAANFTADTGNDWTLTSPDQVTFNYSLVGDTMTMRWSLVTTTVANTPLFLFIKIPNSMTAQESFSSKNVHLLDNSTVRIGLITVTSGSTTIAIQREDGVALANSTNLTRTEGEVSFKVS